MIDLPTGWTNVSIGEINRYQTRIINPSQFPNEKFELYSVPSYADQQPELVFGADIKSSKLEIEENDVLLCKINPRINRVWKVQHKTKYRQIASSEWIVLRQHSLVPSYMRYTLAEKTFRDLMVSEVSGIGGSLTRAQPRKISNYNIKIPPYEEQLKIVAVLDEIWEYAKSSLECLERVQQTIKTLRSSTLRDATNGKLIKHNFLIGVNKEQINYPIPKTWRWYQFNEIAKVSSHLVQPEQFKNFPHIAPNHIESKTGRLLPYTTIEADGVKSPKHLFKQGQILYSKIRPNLAKAIIVDFKGLCSADMYPIETDINSEYLLLWLLSEEFTHQVSQIQGRTVLPKINQKELGAIMVPVPPAQEQEEIAERSHMILNFANQVEEKCHSVKVKIEETLQIILSKAITGDLFKPDLDEASEHNYKGAISLFKNRSSANITAEETSVDTSNVGTKMSRGKSISKDLVQEEIQRIKGETFTFADIEKRISGDYDTLKNVFFEILSDPNSGVEQIFSKDLKEIRFTRGSI